MAPIVVLCLQLIIAGIGKTSWAVGAAPYQQPSAAIEDRTRLGVLFSSSPPTGRAPNISTSKRQLSSFPALIDSGDSFAYRQHHQPPDDGYYGRQQHEESHFRQIQGSNHPAHLNHHRHQPFMHGSPVERPAVELLEQQDYDQQLENSNMLFPGAPASSAEFDNEIGDNPNLFDYGPGTGRNSGSNSIPPNGSNNHNTVESIDLIREQLGRIKEEEDIEIKSNLLMRLLEQMPEGPLPIVYIEDASGSGGAEETPGTPDGSNAEDGSDYAGVVVRESDQITANANKRSGRYYRRYPWKRQNSRSRTYDADARYLCVPSREDVFKLLVGLHENRIGNQQKTINFCNRKRPAKAIFTNIRFLG